MCSCFRFLAGTWLGDIIPELCFQLLLWRVFCNLLKKIIAVTKEII